MLDISPSALFGGLPGELVKKNSWRQYSSTIKDKDSPNCAILEKLSKICTSRISGVSGSIKNLEIRLDGR
jgi:hypothetical protein